MASSSRARIGDGKAAHVGVPAAQVLHQVRHGLIRGESLSTPVDALSILKPPHSTFVAESTPYTCAWGVSIWHPPPVCSERALPSIEPSFRFLPHSGSAQILTRSSICLARCYGRKCAALVCMHALGEGADGQSSAVEVPFRAVKASRDTDQT